MNKLTKKFLKICKKAGYKRVAIGTYDSEIEACVGWPFEYRGSVFCSPDIKSYEWPAVWRIMREMGISGGAGNGQQHQFEGDLEMGSYDLTTLFREP